MLSRRDLGWLLALPAVAKESGFEAVAGRLPPRDRTPIAVEELGSAEAGAGYRRQKVRYGAKPGNPVYAWVLTPEKWTGRAALCLHQTTKIGKDEPAGLGGKPNLHYAHELAQRGYLCLAPDYPSFGDDVTDFPKDVFGAGVASGTMKGIINHRRGVDLLLGRGAKTVVAIGHSLGGHNTLFVTAFDRRIRAAVTSCGFTAMAKYKGGNLKGWDQDRYMPRVRERYQNDPAKLPWDFPDLLRMMAGRRVFISAPLHDDNFDNSGVRDCVRAVGGKFRRGALETAYPDCGHDFPMEVRQQAYAFLDRA
jgi:pimeloyl-ACP methyl ester carboxylesterase